MEEAQLRRLDRALMRLMRLTWSEILLLPLSEYWEFAEEANEIVKARSRRGSMSVAAPKEFTQAGDTVPEEDAHK